MKKTLYCLAMLALSGCNQGTAINEGDDPDDSDVGAPVSLDIQRGRVVAKLVRASTCDDLLTKIQDDVVAKIELQAEQLKRGQTYDTGGGSNGTGGWADAGVDFDDGASTPGAGAGNGGTSGAGGSSGSAGTGAAPMNPNEGGSGDPVDLGPRDFSDTNTQVEGVDEADIVKTDGARIYLVHGNELFVLKSWPASEAAIESSIKIEGRVGELFVHEGKAAVFSTLYDQGDLTSRSYDGQGDADSAQYYPGDYYSSEPFTKITLLDLGGDLPVVQRELIVEGTYLSSRRHGTTVRAVLQGGFNTPPIYAADIEFRDPWGRAYPQDEIDTQVEAWRDRMIAGVRMTTLDDWLPAEREVIDGVLTPPDRRCTDFYAPPPGLSGYGLTNVVAFDILDPNAPLAGALVLGAADEVYSNSDVLLLAQRDYRWDARLAERERTVLHLFDLGEDETAYTASGFAPGHILDQFSLDERDGVVRMTTTTEIWQDWSADVVMPTDDDPWMDIGDEGNTDNRVLTLRVNGSELERAGVSPALGEANERIFSTRFVGDRAYVVTFLQTDPLMVVDISDADDLKLLGELHIPGFSDYMHPIDAGHLLTIGRDADDFGNTRGLLLQIFDVTDPTTPALAHRHAYTQDGWSEANTNHKAFTFYQPGEGSPYEGLLAFPFVNYSSTFQSTLEVFDVSVEGGFTKLGAIDHTQLVMSCFIEDNGGVLPPGAYYDPYYCGEPEVRRGMFVSGNVDDEYVYSISGGGMMIHRLPELGAPITTVTLPQADYAEHRANYGGAGISGGTSGTGGFDQGGAGGVAGGIAGSGAGGSGGSQVPVPIDAGSPEPSADAGADMGGADNGQ